MRPNLEQLELRDVPSIDWTAAAGRFVASPEYLTTQVAGFYAGHLGRQAAPSEVANYVAALRAGTMTMERVEARFLGSPEYAEGFDLSLTVASQPTPLPEAYVARLYGVLFSRLPDQAGFDHWVSELGSGMSREAVALNFEMCVENGDRITTYDFERFLGRRPTGANLGDNSPGDELASFRGMDRQAKLATVLASKEYRTWTVNAGRHVGVPNASDYDTVRWYYWDLLVRDPSETEIRSHLGMR